MLPPDLSYVALPERLPEIPGGWETRTISIAEWRFEIMLPAMPDALLDDPEVLAANEADDYMPYWGHLWPAALEMSRAVLNERGWIKGAPTLEIGCGVGLVGLAAWAAGLPALLTDYEPLSVQLALVNAARNGWPQANGVCLDWRCPPQMSFRYILGCEVLYETRNHPLVLDVLDNMLASDGVSWLVDPQRHQTNQFVTLARDRGYEVNHRLLLPATNNPIQNQIDLWILSKKPPE